jgi:hypothetical protein
LRKLFFAFFTLEVHLVDFNFCEVFLERFLIDLGCATGHRSYFLIIAELMVTFRALIYYFTLRVLTIISVLYLLIMIYLCLKRNSHFVFSKQLLCHYFNLPMQRLNQHLLLLQIISWRILNCLLLTRRLRINNFFLLLSQLVYLHLQWCCTFRHLSFRHWTLTPRPHMKLWLKHSQFHFWNLLSKLGISVRLCCFNTEIHLLD